MLEHLEANLQQVTGYIYPNEIELHWSLLVVIYPYVTGLVAGAFILASLVEVFKVKEVASTYRLALLTALAFLIAAPLPLLAHLGHPERSFQIFLTPHLRSAMAMFGFVYIWYLMLVLLLEIWFEYRADMVRWSSERRGVMKLLYWVLSLGSRDLSEKAVRFDRKAVYAITLVGIPSAFLLHGYVGFIFGSIKANPWWSSVLMPIVFLFSAIVSGIALVLLLHYVTTMFRRVKPDMACFNKLASFLMYALIIDLSLETLDFIHRMYESEESIEILAELVITKLFISLTIVQLLLGTIVPIVLLAIGRFSRIPDEFKRVVFFIAALLVQVGIFSTRWNVVIGGQLFSKSLRGLTVFKMQLGGIEGLFMGIALLILPFVLLWILVKLLPPWDKQEAN
ncbi:MAG: polysulfide reductase NrfD [Acidobacteria bacterium]|uniref:Polysulfide reductase NrfD n=1 Tax=Candidatus Polarisedimenticola svalbardensis TaxID=2886004 RepID=A0A8J6Y9D5_9BACT|nr:polysulfide reductase NrfD [Candidatus Polarisedimenticola svalbardensis]